MSRILALSALVAAAALAAAGLAPPVGAADGGSIGVIGCSNTDQHVAGYLDVSSLDLLADVGDLGGGSLERWYTNERGHWDVYDANEPPSGYDAVWVQICLKAGEHEGSFTGTHQVWMSYVVAEIHRRSGAVPIYVSPLNSYVPGHVCEATGPNGVLVATEIADWAVANLPGVERGPDTGPLGPSALVEDGCHLNSVGKDIVGKQLVSWFDGGLPPGDIPPSGETSFLDIASSVFEEDIEWLAAEGITMGCNPPDNTRFCPTDFVTRGEMAAFLTRALLLPPGPEGRFVDDDASVFEADIESLAGAEITWGCNPPANDRFCPEARITRGEMAAFLNRALDLRPGAVGAFVDDNTSMFEPDIDALAAAGITEGCNPPANDRFCPASYVTRGQMAAFLRRASDAAG